MKRSAMGRGSDRTTQAYTKLRDLIVHGRLAPGSRIIETEVAARLGLSRTPIRSALQRLQQEGYIVEPGGGRQSRPSVSPLTQDDARELFSIVGEVEGLAAWYAAGLFGAARSAVVADLERINSQLREEAERDAPERDRIFELDTQFHSQYVEGGAGPRLRALHEAIKPQAERYIRLYVQALVGEIGVSVVEHQRITEAIADGDADAAQTAVRTNWRNATERFLEVIERAGELGSW